ncbi:putative serine esterase-domain-containing protein, partial [Globomyces pollinis-pini]
MHLIVIIHGLDGFASHHSVLAESLRSAGRNIFVPEVNQGQTYDGIEICSERLYEAIELEIQKVNPSHISFIGHGFGGLIARHVLIHLLTNEWLTRIQPVNFITIGTPHLGANIGNIEISDKSTEQFVQILKQSGKELLAKDDNLILLKLVDKEFIYPLTLFENLIVYSCATVKQGRYQYQTSAISSSMFDVNSCPKGNLPTLIEDGELSLTNSADLNNTVIQMLSMMNQLSWKRIAVIYKKPGKDINRHDLWTSHIGKIMIPHILTYFPIEPRKNRVARLSVTLPEKQAHQHLLVLVHGIEGFNTDMEFIASRFKSRYPSLKVLAPTCNHGMTHDGIMNGALRILDCIIDELESGEIGYISLIGHSLGGMYSRCLIGLLYQNKIIPDLVKPVNFITLATPHLGSREHAKILGDKVASLMVDTIGSQTGRELLLMDHNDHQTPFLLRLIEEPFTRPLRFFEKLIVYSNIRYDAAVHYSTAAIRLNPFKSDLDLNKLVLPAVINDKEEEPLPSDDTSWESMMLNVLLTLPWKRYAVLTGRPLLAHIDIIIKSEFWNLKHGFPIISHLIDHFRTSEQTFIDEASIMRHSFVSLNIQPIHLIVVVHGIDSLSRELLPLIETLRDEYRWPKFRIVTPECNDGQTQDGILNGAVRLMGYLKHEIKHSNANQVSFICHSIGGLYVRCALGLMGQHDLLDDVKLGSFLTIDTAHLGTRFSGFLQEWISSTFLKSLVSKTGKDLNLIVDNQDEKPILMVLIEPDFLRPLTLFQNLVVYSSVASSNVYYSTCAITSSNLPSFEIYP